MDIGMLLDALSGALGGGLQGYQLGTSIEDRKRSRALEEEQHRDAVNYRASREINDAMAGFDKEQKATERRGRLATGNRAILGVTPEGRDVLAALGGDADAVLGDYEPNALDDIINRIRPPKATPEKIDPLSPEGIRATMDLDENRAKLRSRYPTLRAGGGGDESGETKAIMQLLSTLNSQIDDNRMTQQRLSKPLLEAQQGGLDVVPSDTAGLGAAQAEGTRLGGMRNKATTALTASSPVLAKLFAADSATTPPPAAAPGAGNIDLGFTKQGPPRGIAQPLSEKEKFKTRGDEKFRSFLKTKGYTERDWQ